MKQSKLLAVQLVTEAYERSEKHPVDRLTRVWAVLWPELGSILERHDVRPFHELMPPNGPRAFWEKARHLDLLAVWRVRSRRQKRIPVMMAHVQAAKEAVHRAKERVGSLGRLPAIGNLQLEPSLLDQYPEAMARVLTRVHFNRMAMLSEIECGLHRNGKGSLPDYDAFFASLDEETSAGRPVSQEIRERRKSLVVRLLATESDRHEPYQSPEDLFMDLEIEDEGWSRVRSVRKYFQDWMGEKMPGDLAGWRSLAKFWSLELEMEYDTGYVPRT